MSFLSKPQRAAAEGQKKREGQHLSDEKWRQMFICSINSPALHLVSAWHHNICYKHCQPLYFQRRRGNTNTQIHTHTHSLRLTVRALTLRWKKYSKDFALFFSDVLPNFSVRDPNLQSNSQFKLLKKCCIVFVFMLMSQPRWSED